MNRLTIYLTAALICAPSLVLAVEKTPPFYFKAGLGLAKYTKQTNVSSVNAGYQIEYKNGIGFYGTFGKNIGSQFALELELHRQKADFDGIGSNNIPFNFANSDYRSLMLNIIWRPQILTESPYINPYIGVGMGKSKLGYQVPASPLSKSENTLSAKQLILGNRFDLTDNYFIDTEYRYFKTENSKVVTQNGIPLEFKNSGSHSLVVSYGRNF